MSGILVIGRTGQLARALAEQDAGLILWGRETLDLERTGEIARRVAEAAPRLVINAAAYTAVDQAESEPDRAHAINATAVGEIAKGAARAGAGLIHISTDYVFAGDAKTPHPADATTRPINVYGASKHTGEVLASAALDRLLILRTSWVVSPWGKNFVRSMLRLADRDRLTIVDDQWGRPTSAADLAAACLAIAPRLVAAPAGAPVWGIQHFAGAPPTTWARFAEAIFADALASGLIGRAPEVARIPTEAYPTPAARPRYSVLDCTGFEACFSIGMPDWRDALGQIIRRIGAAPAAP